MLTAILWILFLGSLLGAGAIVVRKFPELALLDVSTIAREREKKVKYDIIRERVERSGREAAAVVRRGLRPAMRHIAALFRMLYERVLDLERRYRHTGRTVNREQTVQALMEAARELASKGELLEAERKYIEVIAIDPRRAKAYEEIGRLAVKSKRFDEAEQAFRHVLKINPDDASAHANYGELELARGNVRAAVLRFEDAVRRKPASPKYLSFLLEAAIAAGSRDLARQTFGVLKEVNPDNQKLPQWEQRIREM